MMNGDVILLLSMLFSCNLRRFFCLEPKCPTPQKGCEVDLVDHPGVISMLVGDTIFWQSSLKFVNYDSLAT